MGRSILAIAAGFIAVVVLSVGTDAIMHGLGVFPPPGTETGDGQFLLAIAYRSLFTLFGGWLAARLSARSDLRDVQILAGLGFLAGVAGLVAWSVTPDMGPLWFAVLIPVTGVVFTLLGGRFGQSLR